MRSTAASTAVGSAASKTPAVVLDTNIVLDWLVFKDSRVEPVTSALQHGSLHWLSCHRMRGELERTLSYPALKKWKPDSERVLTSFDEWAQIRLAPLTPHPVLRCDDTDDQVFLDLAMAHGARWLISHDRALLRLRRRAKAFGLTILSPQEWRLEWLG